MRTVPRTLARKIGFYETHVTKWTANAEAIGTTTGLVADLRDKTNEAREAQA